MKSLPPLRRAGALIIVALAVLSGLAALKKGDTVFSKRNETFLLSEPRPLAPSSAKVGFAEPLEVEEVRGNWLRVKAKKVKGWVFLGNVSEEKPRHAPAAGLTTVAASETNTVAAARPLAPAAEGFAARHDAGSAKADVEWLDAEAAKTLESEVVAYLRDHQKGEYAP
ncbi:MAG TPA: SH3 domain-containing protein [Opitutaceae bacterium]